MAADDANRTCSCLPPKVVVEILKRVPARSLCRFRCVSKLWRSIIADRGFMSAHWAHSRSHPMPLTAVPCSCDLSYSDSDRTGVKLYGDIRIDMQPPPPAAALTGLAFDKFNGLGWEYMPRSVGGLICLEGLSAADDCIKICNPSTWEYVTLPDPRPEEPLGLRWTSLCFDPVAREHKVLWFSGDEVRIFAPGSGTTSTSWRRIRGMTRHAQRSGPDEVCVNGILYYMVDVGEEGRFMARFHVNSERFDVTKLNSMRGGGKWRSKLVEYLNGRVAVVDCPSFKVRRSWLWDPPPSDYMDVIRLWVLEAEGNWSLHKLVLPSLPRCGRLSPVGSIRAGEYLVFLWTLHKESFCLFYDSKKETFSGSVLPVLSLVPPQLNRPYYPHYTLAEEEVHNLSLADHEDNLLALEAFKLAIN